MESTMMEGASQLHLSSAKDKPRFPTQTSTSSAEKWFGSSCITERRWVATVTAALSISRLAELDATRRGCVLGLQARLERRCWSRWRSMTGSALVALLTSRGPDESCVSRSCIPMQKHSASLQVEFLERASAGVDEERGQSPSESQKLAPLSPHFGNKKIISIHASFGKINSFESSINSTHLHRI